MRICDALSRKRFGMEIKMSISGIGYHYYQNNTTANRNNQTKTGSYLPKNDAWEQESPGKTTRNASAWDIYEAYKAGSSYKERVRKEENSIPGENSLQVWFGDKTLEEWARTDPKYTDTKTGFSWYVRDGKHPYMTGEDAEKFKQMCRETGESWLKKFAEMTGMIQHLDDNTTAYVGTNGTAIKSKDGKELFIDTSSFSYDMIMNLFKNRPDNGNYFDTGYWQENIQKAQSSAKESSEEEKPSDSDEQKTDTEIIVKPDGSKIMMTTIRVGGMETVMSMEIAKPTNILEGNTGGTIDNPNMMISDTSPMIESTPNK